MRKKDKEQPGGIPAETEATEKRGLSVKAIIAIVLAVCVVAGGVIAAIAISNNMKTKSQDTVLTTDIQEFVKIAQGLYDEEVGMDKRMFGDTAEALEAFVTEFNNICPSSKSAYRLSYSSGSSIARGKADPWNNQYMVTAKAADDNAEESTYTFYVISAGKNGTFNSKTFLLDEDDTCQVLVQGAAMNSGNNADQSTNANDPNFGIGDILASKEPEPSDDPAGEESTIPTRVKISFNNQGGSGGPSEVTVKNGTPLKYVNITVPVRTNFTFLGYYSLAEGMGTQYFDENGMGIGDANFESSLTLYACWVGDPAIITLDNEGGTGAMSVTGHYDSKYPNVTIPSRTGYKFLGYYTKPNGEGEKYYNSYGSSSKICTSTAPLTLYAYWGATSYTVEHYVMGTDGNYTPSPQYSEKRYLSTDGSIRLATLADSSLIIPNGIVYDHATINGDQAVTAEIPDNDTVIRIYYKRCQYRVELSADKGVSSVKGAGTYYYGSRVSIEATLAAGCDWQGWIDLDSSKVLSTDQRYSFTMPARSLCIEATAATETYTVFLEANGGKVSPTSVVVTYGETFIEKLPTPTRTGYSFVGWAYSRSDEKGLSNTTKYELKNDTTLYALWQGNDATIYLNNMGGTGGQQQITVKLGGTLPKLSELPERLGYTFAGFYTGKNGTGTQYYSKAGTPLNSANLSSGTTLYADWTPNTIRINYYDRNGEVFSGYHGANAPTYAPFETSVALVTPVRDNYSFDGWYLDAACTQKVKYLYVTDPTLTSINVYAKWSNRRISIVYRDEGNKTFTGTLNEDAPLEVELNDTVTLIAPTRGGYNFLGWFSDEKCKTPVTTLSPTDGTIFSITVYAKWEALTYSIEYREADGTAFAGVLGENSPTEVTSGTTVKLVNPTREGYEFCGWYSDQALTKRITSVTPSGSFENPILVYAKWKQVQ